MRFGVTLPNLGLAGGPDLYCDLAVEAEEAGWDGVFLFDAIWSKEYDPPWAWDVSMLLASMGRVLGADGRGGGLPRAAKQQSL